MNILDNIISVFSPKLALSRAQSRAALGLVIQQKRQYEGAGRGRRFKNWKTNGSSANTTLRMDLFLLRQRSRSLTENNPYAKRAIQAIANNTIGTGIRPKPFGLQGDAERKLKSLWMEWAETTECDYDENLTFYGLQKLCMRCIVESGEVLIVRKFDKRKLKIQILEPDFIDIRHDGPNEMGLAVLGVQFDKLGKKLGYWLFESHPGDINLLSDYTSKFHKKDNVLHVFEVLRPGQVRGVPFSASVMLRLRDFDEYEDAQLIRQKIAACFTAFVQTSSVDSFDSEDDEILERMEPGIIEVLPPGKTVTFASPPGTNTDYSPYTTKVLQAVAAGFGVPYEILTTDLSNVNFSSGRMGWIEFYRNITGWQDDMIIPKICQSVWRWFGDWLVLTGKIRETVPATWTTPRRYMIDPTKETAAMITAVQSGLKSWQEAIREMGYDPDDVGIEFMQDYAMWDKYGMKVTVDMRGGSTKSTAPNDESEVEKEQE